MKMTAKCAMALSKNVFLCNKLLSITWKKNKVNDEQLLNYM